VDHTELIQSLIDGNDFRRYLEIGVDQGLNFAAVRCDLKVGVDPSPGSAATHQLTSDEFFSADDREWDLVFVDGLHHADQVRRDVENALDRLAERGVVVCHDMNPSSERMQRVPREVVVWTGDCWRAWVELRSRPGLDMRVIDTDFGCGVITRGDGVVLVVDGLLTYEGLEANRKEWLNLVTVDEWLAGSGHPLAR
jgi:Methyltransferase domain